MQKVLHVLLDREEAMPLAKGDPFRLNTHGIESVVIQVERARRYTVQAPSPQKALIHYKRKKTKLCEWCQKLFSPQGWAKHASSCMKRKKGGAK